MSWFSDIIKKVTEEVKRVNTQITKNVPEEIGRIGTQFGKEVSRVAENVGEETGRIFGQIGDEVSRVAENVGDEFKRTFTSEDEEPLPLLDPAGPTMTTADTGMSDPLNTRFFETVGKGRKRKGKGRSATIFGGQGEGVRPSLLSMKNTQQPKQLLGA
jgi:hypothetical protein